MAKYYDIWKSASDVATDYMESNLIDAEIVYAGYTYEDYSGDALVVFRRDGKWFENHDGHCSCYGLENWAPEETTPEAILMRPENSWPGLHEEVRRAVAESAAPEQSGSDRCER